MIANTDVSTCILGISKPEQIEQNVKAIELYKKWTPEIEKKVREIMDTEPTAARDFLVDARNNYNRLPYRRDIAVKFDH